jgi:hypothetical protein
MKRMASLLSICAVMLWTCSGGADPDASEDEQFTLPSEPAKSLSPARSSVTGLLGFDDVEGGCSYLEAPDGTRYEVIYPDGWAIDRASGELRASDGRVAGAGESVTVRGAVATDRSSTCQIGPIFVATDVEIEPR